MPRSPRSAGIQNHRPVLSVVEATDRSSKTGKTLCLHEVGRERDTPWCGLEGPPGLLAGRPPAPYEVSPATWASRAVVR